MTKTALVALANGTEEVEVVTVIDLLRRAGMDVTIATVGDSLAVRSAQNIKIEGDKLMKDIPESEKFDVIVVPGGKGAQACRDCARLTKLLQEQNKAGRWIAAICGAPAIVLTHHGLLDNAKAVAYPSQQKDLKHKGEGRVCVDKHFITSLGPGTSVEFSLEIIKNLLGDAKKKEIAESVCA